MLSFINFLLDEIFVVFSKYVHFYIQSVNAIVIFVNTFMLLKLLLMFIFVSTIIVRNLYDI